MINTFMKMSTTDQKKLEKIYEDMTAGSVLGGGENMMGIENEDSYAPDDARNPFGLGITTRNGKLKRKKVKKVESYDEDEEDSTRYQLTGTCVDFEDGMEVQEITQQDDLSYGEDTYYHDPNLQISPEKFQSLTGEQATPDNFYGFNEYTGHVFKYVPNEDVHYFYERS